MLKCQLFQTKYKNKTNESEIRFSRVILDANLLKLAPGKTDAVVFHRDHRRVNGVSFRVGQVEVAFNLYHYQ